MPDLSTSQPPRALVISPNAWTTTCCANLLTERGYRVHQASNGFSGLRQAQAHEPNLVVLAGELPDVPAAEVHRQLAEATTVCRLPARLDAAAARQLMSAAAL